MHHMKGWLRMHKKRNNPLKEVFVKIADFFKPIIGKIKNLPFWKKAWAFIKKHKIVSSVTAIVLVAAITMTAFGAHKRKAADKSADAEAEAERRTISESISGSSAIEANDEYSVVPLVTGEILTADFEEGDIVKKDQVLYKIDSSTVETSVKSADLAVEKSQIAYDKALKSHTDEITGKTNESNALSIQKAQNTYNEALDSVNDLTVRAGSSGTVSEVYVSVGDKVTAGTKIAEITDNDYLKVRVPFNSSDADNIYSGESASVTLVDSGTVLSGTVSSVSSGSESTVGSMRVKYVTIEVENPGAVREGESVTAMIGGYACNDVGAFESAEKRTVIAEVSGDISSVWVVKGDYLLDGSTVATINSDSVDKQRKDAEISLREAKLKQESAKLEQMDGDDYAAKLKSARLALDDALLQRDKMYKELDDYTIKSPIDGTVVSKKKKAGDKIENGGGASAAASASSSSSSNVLAVIYDMSSLCFELSVDELDVKKVQVGQEVEITADAVDGKTYTGIVENVSVNGTVGTNGVTTYPAKVRIQDADDKILPGMNIDAVITVEKAENVIAVPLRAVNRGNTVYIKGDKADDSDKAPEGFKTVQVETGISDDNYIEIKSGVAEGDTVYVTPLAGSNNQQMPDMGEMPGGGAPGGGAPGGSGMPGGNGGSRAGGSGMPGGGGR